MIKLEVIGNPIKHSLSPTIHSAVMDYLDISYLYQAVEVKENELEGYIKRVKEEKILGFNVTMPHKQNIMSFLSHIDEEALLYNAVNTVKNENGKLYGYNTDGERIFNISGE